MNNHYIYKITNCIGQIYIGHTNSIYFRKASYKSLNCKGQKLIYKSLKHFSWVKHKFEIVFAFNDKELDFEIVEKFFISFFNSYFYDNKQYGLNLTKGGQHCDGQIFKNKPYKPRKNRKPKKIKRPNTGWKHTEEYKIFMSKLRTGTKVSEEGCKNIGKSKKGQIPVNRRKILQFDLDGTFIKEYNSIFEASKETNVSTSAVNQCAQGKIKKPKKFIFKYK